MADTEDKSISLNLSTKNDKTCCALQHHSRVFRLIVVKQFKDLIALGSAKCDGHLPSLDILTYITGLYIYYNIYYIFIY